MDENKRINAEYLDLTPEQFGKLAMLMGKWASDTEMKIPFHVWLLLPDKEEVINDGR